MVEFIKTLLIACIPSVIAGVGTYLVAKKNASSQIKIVKEQNRHDLDKLIKILQQLADNGNTILIIEHNLDLIKIADHVIDLGPEGGDFGGEVIACGTPEEVSKEPNSFTGQYLKPFF